MVQKPECIKYSESSFWFIHVDADFDPLNYLFTSNIATLLQDFHRPPEWSTVCNKMKIYVENRNKSMKMNNGILLDSLIPK